MKAAEQQLNRGILDDLCTAVEHERSQVHAKASEWRVIKNAVLRPGNNCATLLKAEDIDEPLKEGSTTVIRIDGKEFAAEVVGMAFGELELLIKECDLAGGLTFEFRVPFDDYLTSLHDFLRAQALEVVGERFPRRSLALANAVALPHDERNEAGYRVSYVMGAPGSGKTEALVSKALKLVGTGMNGMRVMIITYTNAAADVIFGRLALRVGDKPDVQLTRLGLTEASIEIEQRARSENVNSTMSISQAMESNLTVTTAYRALMCAKKELGTHAVVLFDEASTLPISLAWATSLIASEQITLYGDPFQLGPIVQSYPLREHTVRQRFGTSPFEIEGVMKSAEEDKGQVVLSGQYRLPSALANATCPPLYKSAGNAAGNSMGEPESPWGVGSFLFINSSSHDATCEKFMNSRRNEIHADLVVKLVGALLEQEIVEPHEIAKSLLIITPYKAQRSLISRRLNATGWIPLTEIRALVTTVHRAQGSEREYVIFDVTEAPNSDKIIYFPVGRLWNGEGWQSDGSRLLTTALTRARKQAIVLVHREYVSNSSTARKVNANSLHRLNSSIDKWGAPATIKLESMGSKKN